MQNTIVLTVHNKEATIKRVLTGISKTTSQSTSRVLIILDGCTDNTEQIVRQYIERCCDCGREWDVILTPDIWETRANNIGLRNAQTTYVTILQDDMLLEEVNWDLKLIGTLESDNVFAVTGRTVHDFIIHNGLFKVVNPAGREYPLGSSGIIPKIIAKIVAVLKLHSISCRLDCVHKRLIANRGPLIMKTDHVRGLGYLDERYAPFELDDADLCCRAFKKYGLISAVNTIGYTEIGGSKKMSKQSAHQSKLAIKKNSLLLFADHADLMNSEYL